MNANAAPSATTPAAIALLFILASRCLVLRVPGADSLIADDRVRDGAALATVASRPAESQEGTIAGRQSEVKPADVGLPGHGRTGVRFGWASTPGRGGAGVPETAWTLAIRGCGTRIRT